MKKSIWFGFLAVGAFLFSDVANCQQPLKWRLGFYGEVDFSGIPGIALLSQDTLPTSDSNASAWDSLGNIIIHTNGIAVWDANGDTMPNSGLVYNSTYTVPEYGSNITNGAIILNRPGHQGQYYLFHTKYGTTSPTIYFYGELFYSIIDLNLNGGLGAVTASKNILLADTAWAGVVNAVRHANGRDWWLISGRSFSSIIYTWLITPDTILGPNSISMGMYTTLDGAQWQSNFSPDGTKLAIAYRQTFGVDGNVALLADFDRCTGMITDTIILRNPTGGPMQEGITGVEFSPSGRFLYTCTGNTMYQYDLSSTNIPTSRINIKQADYNPAPFTTSFNNQKRGPDGRVYGATGNGNWAVDVINNPDSLGTSCDMQLRQINYNSMFSATYAMNILVMPNYPNYQLGAISGSPCDTLTSLNEHLSIDENPLHIYPNPAVAHATINYQLEQNQAGILTIYNTLGEIVLEKTLLRWSSTTTIDSNLPSGIYQCLVQSGDRRQNGKLVIE